MTDYSSVDSLQQAFDEARVEAQTHFDINFQLLTDLAVVRQEVEEAVAALNTQTQTLQEVNKHFWSSLADLNATHNALMAHSLSQTEQIGDMRRRLPEKQPPLLPFLRPLLLTLPTDFTNDNTPDDSFYHFFCADPAADQTTLASNAKTLLRFLHLDKSPNPDDPAVKAAAHLVPLITHIKRDLTIPALRIVYDQCGFTGLQRLMNHKFRCIIVIVCQWRTRAGRFDKDPWNILSYVFCWRTVLRSSPLSGATSVCGLGPSGWGLLDTPPLFSCAVSARGLVLCQVSFLTWPMFCFQLSSLLQPDVHFWR